MLKITNAEYLDGYRMRISFDNGETCVVDLTDALWGPVFEALKALTEFRQSAGRTARTLHRSISST